MSRVIVIGGGILGLFVARELGLRGRSVTLLESSPVLGGLGRKLDIGGFELDLGVRILPNKPANTIQGFIEATGGIHRYVPMVDRIRHRRGTDMPSWSAVQHLSLPHRLEVLLYRLTHGCPHPESEFATLEELGSAVFTPTVWTRMVRRYYETLYGNELAGLAANNHRVLGTTFPTVRSYGRALRDGLVDVLRPLAQGAGLKPKERILSAPSRWPKTTVEAGRESCGLYPLEGSFSRFTAAMVEGISDVSDCDIRVKSPLEELDVQGDRMRRIKAGGSWVEGDEFIFTAGIAQVFATVGLSLPPVRARSLVQVNLLVRSPIPPWLWEENHDGGCIARVFYPQRFQGLTPGDRNVIACETYTGLEEANRLRIDPSARINQVVDELITMGMLSAKGDVVESNAVVVPNVLSMFPARYFECLGETVAACNSQLLNVHFTGMPATLAPVMPANNALTKAMELAARLGGIAADSREKL